MIYLLLSFIFASADLGIKTWVDKQPKEKFPKSYAGGMVELRKETNKGFACNRMDEEPEVVQRLSAIALGIITVLMLPMFLSKKLTGVEKLGLSFLLGGAISNVAERNLRGYVVDYIHVKTDKLYKADNKLPKDVDAVYRDAVKRCPLGKLTFNLADALIVLGAVISGSGMLIRSEVRTQKKLHAKAK